MRLTQRSKCSRRASIRTSERGEGPRGFRFHRRGIAHLNYVDVLRIVYDRPKNFFHPSSRVYKFPRVQDAVKGGDDKGKGQVVMKTHPLLLQAVDELKTILEARSTKHSITADILSEIELLEEDIALRSECLKRLVKKIPEI